MSSSRISLKEVARAAGVSLGTASQSLRNDANNSRATCERVQAVARRLGYVPDPVLARLAARKFHRTKQLSQAPVVFVTYGRPPAGRQKVPRYGHELEHNLKALGYTYRHMWVDDRDQLHRARQRWWQQGVRGVIFGMFDHADWLGDMDWSAFSVMFIGGQIQQSLFHTVKADSAEQCQLALDTMIRSVPSGRLGVILHRHSTELPDDLLREGMARTLLSRLPARRQIPPLFETFGQPYEDEVGRIRVWLKTHRPAGVAGMRIVQAQMRDAGFPGIPFFAVNCDEGENAAGATEPVGDEARRAAEWIDGMIRHGERGIPGLPLRIVVQSRWSAAP